MLQALLQWQIGRAERRLGDSLDYARDLARGSPSAFLAFAGIRRAAAFRRRLPADAWHVAHLLITLHEDCGQCAQIAVDLARRDGVSADTLRAVAARRPEDLNPQLRDVYAFAESFAAGGDGAPVREALAASLGPAAMAELCLCVAMASAYPRVRRAMGRARACSAVALRI